MPEPAAISTQAATPITFRATPTVIVTLNTAGQLCAELPGPAGRRKIELRNMREGKDVTAAIALLEARDDEGKATATVGELRTMLQGLIEANRVEAVLVRTLEGMARKAYNIGEDGAPTQSQVRHWERHDIWSDPQCPHCVGEGRFPPKAKNHDRRITKADAAALALRARGYVERSAGKWYRQGFATVVVSPSGVVSSPNLGKWSKEDVARLRDEGQKEANLRQYTSLQFRRDVLVAHSDGTVVRKTQSTKASREAAIAAKVERVMRTITF